MTAAACPLCSRIAAGLGRPTCPLCHGTAAITLGHLAENDTMAAAVAIAIRRGLDTTLEEATADDIDTAAAVDEYAAGLRLEGYLAHRNEHDRQRQAAATLTIVDEVVPFGPDQFGAVVRHLDARRRG